MTPKTLKDWLHHADDEILARFIANHQNLIAQLMQAWQRQLDKEQTANSAIVPGEKTPLAEEESSKNAACSDDNSLSPPAGGGAAEQLRGGEDEPASGTATAAAHNPQSDTTAPDAFSPLAEESSKHAACGDDTLHPAAGTAASTSPHPASAHLPPQAGEGIDSNDEFAPLEPPTPDIAMPLTPHKPAPTAIQPPPIHLPPLPNANQGQPYDHTLPADLPITGLSIETADSGLVWDAAARRLHGIPTTSGDLPIRITLRDNDKEVPLHLNLHINPDPKSLWQDLPSDQNGPFAKPDSARAEQTTPHGRLIAARQRGRSHAHVGSYCDDDYRIAYHAASGLHLLTVADGAGSAQYARYGSQLAVEAVKNTIIALLDDPNKPHHKLAQVDPAQREKIAANLITHALHAAHKAHVEAAQQHGLDAKSLSCTLLIALAVPLADGSWYHAAYQVGDGAAALWQPENSQLHLLGEADSGAYSGETQFLSRAQLEETDIARRIRHHSGHAPAALILMTDGVSDPKFETDAGLKNPALWQALWQDLATPLAAAAPDAALLEWLDFWSRGNHDDRTIALLIPHDKERS